MAIWAAAVGGALSAGGAIAAGDQSARAAKRAYKNRYQWTVEDLKKAGLNPMLAMNQGAPVPNTPQYPNAGEAAARGVGAGVSAASMARQAQASLENTKADTDLKRSQAAAAEASAVATQAAAAGSNIRNAIDAETIPYAGANARATYRHLDAMGRQANNTADKVAEEVLIAKNEREQQEAMYPLLVEHQRFINTALRLGMSEKEAESEFWDQLPEAKYGPVIRLLKELLSK